MQQNVRASHIHFKSGLMVCAEPSLQKRVNLRPSRAVYSGFPVTCDGASHAISSCAVNLEVADLRQFSRGGKRGI